MRPVLQLRVGDTESVILNPGMGLTVNALG